MEDFETVDKYEAIDEKQLRACGALLLKNHLRLVCAESMTAGYLASLWGMEVNSGNYFLGSTVCYHDTMKNSVLGVSLSKIKKYCAESAVVTLRMLAGLQKLISDADVYVSITGLAFKTVNAKQRRPIGTVYYAFHYARHTKIFKRRFSGNSAAIFIATCNSLIKDLCNWLHTILHRVDVENAKF